MTLVGIWTLTDGGPLPISPGRDLSSNRLSSLHGSSFGSLRRLQELNLDRNTFSKVPSKALDALVGLEVL